MSKPYFVHIEVRSYEFSLDDDLRGKGEALEMFSTESEARNHITLCKAAPELLKAAIGALAQMKNEAYTIDQSLALSRLRDAIAAAKGKTK